MSSRTGYLLPHLHTRWPPRRGDFEFAADGSLHVWESILLIELDDIGREVTRYEARRTQLEPPGSTDLELADTLMHYCKTTPWDTYLIECFAQWIVSAIVAKRKIKGTLAIPQSIIKFWAKGMNRRRYWLLKKAQAMGFTLHSLDKGDLQSKILTFVDAGNHPGRWFKVREHRLGDLSLLSCNPEEMGDGSPPFGINPYPLIVHNGGDWRVEVRRTTLGADGKYRLAVVIAEKQALDGGIVSWPCTWASKPYISPSAARKCADKVAAAQARLRAPVEWIACVHPDEADIYAGRTERHTRRRQSVWANPYVVAKDGDLAACLADYRDYLLSDRYLLSQLPTLKGRRVGCFCCKKGDRLNIDDPLRCHVQVMAQVLRDQENQC